MNSVSTFSQQFILGMMTPIRAVGVIFSSPKLLALSAIPILITLVTLSILLYSLITGFWNWITTQLSSVMTGWLATAIFVLGLIYIAINILGVLTSLFSSPFNDLLAEATERHAGVTDSEKFSFKRLLRVFFLDLRKTLLTLSLTVLFTFILWVPVVGIIAFLPIALLNTLTYVTYPQSRRMHGVFSSLGWIRKNLGLSLGFGLVTTLLFSIPVVNVFSLPVAVVGGTLLFLKIENSRSV